MTSPVHPKTALAGERPLIRLPMWKLSACLLAAPKAVLFTGLLVAVIIGGDLWDDRLKAEFWAGVVLYSGTIAGLAFLWAFGPRPAFHWGPIVIASSVIRMVVSLAGAVTIALQIHPERGFFWTVFLIASFLILGIEAAVIRRALNSTIAISHRAAKPESESKAA